MEELPPTDPALRHHTLTSAAALFQAGVAMFRYRQLLEWSIRLLDESRRSEQGQWWRLDVPDWLSRSG